MTSDSEGCLAMWWESIDEKMAVLAIIRASAEWMLKGNDLEGTVTDPGVGEQLWAVYEGLA
jgi:hypothetical protein